MSGHARTLRILPELTDEERAMEGIHPERLRKLQELRALGRDPFAFERWDRTHSLADIRAENEKLAGATVKVAGRIHSLPVSLPRADGRIGRRPGIYLQGRAG